MDKSSKKSSGFGGRYPYEWQNIDIKKLQAEGKLVRCKLPISSKSYEDNKELAGETKRLEKFEAADYHAGCAKATTLSQASDFSPISTLAKEAGHQPKGAATKAARKGEGAAPVNTLDAAPALSDDQPSYRSLEPGERELYEAFDGSPPPCKILPICTLKPHEKLHQTPAIIKSPHSTAAAQTPTEATKTPSQHPVADALSSEDCLLSDGAASSTHESADLLATCAPAKQPLAAPNPPALEAAAARVLALEAERTALADRLAAARKELLALMQAAGCSEFHAHDCRFQACDAKSYLSLDIQALRADSPELFDELFSSFGRLKSTSARLEIHRRKNHS